MLRRDGSRDAPRIRAPARLRDLGRRRQRSVHFGLLVAALIVSCSLPTLASEGRGRVLLVVVPAERGGWPAAEARASFELGALGFTVVRATYRQPEQALSDAALTVLVQRTGARAAVRFIRPDAAPAAGLPVSVHVVDRSTGRFEIRSIGPDRMDDSLGAEEAALLASELVYSVLASARRKAPPPEAPPPEAPPPHSRPTPPTVATSPEWAARVGVAVTGSPGITGVSGGLRLSGTWLPHPELAMDLQLDLPVLPATFAHDLGTARLYLAGERFHLRFVAWPQHALFMSLGLGGGLLHMWACGEAAPPLVTKTDAGTVGLVSAMSLVGLRLSGTAALFAEGRAALAIPEPSVSFAGLEISRFGSPLLDGSAGLQLVW